MFDAYRVAVKLSLVNNVSTGLLGISRQLIGTGKDVDALQAKLSKLKKLTLIGGAMSASGVFGLGMIGNALKPATEYAHQLNIMNMAGLKQKELADAIGDAWKNTGTVITTTATENLRSLLDLRNVLGSMDEARMALPIVSRIQAVLASSSEGQISGNSKDLAYSMAKALDIIGAAQNKQSFERQAELMAKVIIATQGRVTPEAFKSTFQYARQAKYNMTDEFKYGILPSLIQENAASGGGGGGSRGVGPMIAAFHRWAVQGYINKKSLPELQSLGLVDASSALRTTTEGTTIGGMKYAELAAQNSYEWTQTVLIPALQRKYGEMTKDQMMMHIAAITRGNQLAGGLIGEYAFKPINFQRDQANIRGTMSTADAYKAALGNDPNLAFKALSSQWENFKVSFTMGVVPVLVPALIKLSHWFNELGVWARENPNLAKNLAIGFTALSASMAFGGTVMLLKAGFSGLGLVLSAGGAGGMVGQVTAVSSAIKIMSTTLLWAKGILVAGAVGWGIGTLISDNMSDDMKERIGRRLTKFMARMGSQEAQDALDSESRFVRSQHQSRAMINNTIVMPDGRVLARVVTNEQTKESAKPQAGAARFDGRMTPAHVGASGSW